MVRKGVEEQKEDNIIHNEMAAMIEPKEEKNSIHISDTTNRIEQFCSGISVFMLWSPLSLPIAWGEQS